MWGPRGSAQHPTAHRTAQGRRARGSGLVEAGCPPTCAQRPIPVACCFHSGSELSGWRKCFQSLADSWLWRDPWVPWGEMGDTPPHSEIQVPTPVASGCASRVPCPQAQKVQSVELITSCGARPGGRTWRDFQVQAPASPLWRVLLVPSPLRAAQAPVARGLAWFPCAGTSTSQGGPAWCQPSQQACPHPEDIGEALCFYSSLYKWYVF